MKIYRSETEVRISHTKKCDRQTDRGQTHRHSCLEKALLALKMHAVNLIRKVKFGGKYQKEEKHPFYLYAMINSSRTRRGTCGVPPGLGLGQG